MTADPAPDLYASRLAVRFFENGRAFLGSLLAPASVPLSPPAAAALSALWDKGDRRPTAERLRRPGVPEDEATRAALLERLVQASLLVPAGMDEEAAWLSRQEEELLALPNVDQVELSNACPFTCRFCPRGLGKMTRPIGHLDLGLLADLVAQVKHLKARKPFGLHHFGDPLLHPDPAGAVRIVREAGLEPELSLNPILLNRELAAQLLDAGVGVLIVSLDGLDTATLQAMRGKAAGAFGQVERNVEMLIELCAARSSPPTVMVSMVATTLNRHQWHSLFARYARQGKPWLVPVVRLLEDFGDPAIAPLGVRRLRQLCGSPYKSVSVLWDGTVVPCCHDYDGATPLGDLKRQSLEEIWRSDQMRRFRQRFKDKSFAPNEACVSCRWRPDLYLCEDEVADTDAWTDALWPEQGFPPREQASGSRPQASGQAQRNGPEA